MVTRKNIIFKLSLFFLGILLINACTNLDKDIYSEVPEEDFWQTQEEIESGQAPAYLSLGDLASPMGDLFMLNENTTDEVLLPTRGADWFDNGRPQMLWEHKWDKELPEIDNTWKAVFDGIGKVNYSVDALENLEDKPEDVNVAASVAELKVLRAYYYMWALDLWGNVPIVDDFETPPDSVANSPQEEVFNFIEDDLLNNINKLDESAANDTYGRVNKYTGLSILAKLYLNAEVYIGEEHWQNVIDITDSIIESGEYSLNPNFFDNFSPDNGPDSPENIFVVPFDKVNIKGMGWPAMTLHYQSNESFGLNSQPYNGFSCGTEFYNTFDTTSTYRTEGNRVYRTYNDQRSGQWLVGQQYAVSYSFPPDQDVLVEAPDSLKVQDASTGLDLSFDPNIETFSSDEDEFRLKGARNIKYFPESGAIADDQSNDVVLFRYADILLMKAEAEVRIGNKGNAKDLINQIRERAYGDSDHDWNESDVTMQHILDERGRELSWEMWRRQDLIRFQIAGDGNYFSEERFPEKSEDPNHHTLLYPIPKNQLSANPNLDQNEGYK